MPNLRGKTWTTTTPANVGDAQYWEDHLISDAVAAKAASSVQSVNNTTPDAQGNVDVVALPDGGTVGQVLTKQSSVDGDADWEDPASSGHTIEDEDGNTMPYQETLQFVSAEVTNDSVNNKTIVDCKGSKGDAATITVGTVTTLPAGSQATVNNSGTSSDAVFDFGIPKGADGSGSGDMTKAEYATNGAAGVVDEAVTLKGLTASIADLNKTSSLATVATSGSYNDLSNKPTAGTGIAINNNIIAVDADNTPTENSEKPVKSKGVYSALESNREESTTLLKSTVGWTGKNLLPNNSASTKTESNVTYTRNSDKSVSISTSAASSAVTYFDLTNPQYTVRSHETIEHFPLLKNFQGKEIRISSGTNNANIRITLGIKDSSNNSKFDIRTDGSAGTSNKGIVPTLASTDVVYYTVRLASGVNLSEPVIVKPMVCDSSYPEDIDYAPYHPSVEEEIEQIYADNGVLGAKNLWDLDDSFSPSESASYTVSSGTLTISMTAIQNSGIWMSGSQVLNPRYAKFVGIRGRLSFDYKGDASFSALMGYYAVSDHTQKSYNVTTNWQHYESYDIADLSAWAGSILFYNTSGASHTLQVKNIMLRLASDPDDTYVPYAMTNRELTEKMPKVSLANTDVKKLLIFVKSCSFTSGVCDLDVSTEISGYTLATPMIATPVNTSTLSITGVTKKDANTITVKAAKNDNTLPTASIDVNIMLCLV